MSERRQITPFRAQGDNTLWRNIVTKVLMSVVALVVVTLLKSQTPDDGVSRRLDAIEGKLNGITVVQQQNSTVAANSDKPSNAQSDVSPAVGIGTLAGLILGILLF